MFEVGKKYDFEFLDARDDKGYPDVTRHGAREVLAVDGTLVKIRDGSSGEMIVNTASPLFARAELSRPPSGRFSVNIRGVTAPADGE